MSEEPKDMWEDDLPEPTKPGTPSPADQAGGIKYGNKGMIDSGYDTIETPKPEIKPIDPGKQPEVKWDGDMGEVITPGKNDTYVDPNTGLEFGNTSPIQGGYNTIDTPKPEIKPIDPGKQPEVKWDGDMGEVITPGKNDTYVDPNTGLEFGNTSPIQGGYNTITPRYPKLKPIDLSDLARSMVQHPVGMIAIGAALLSGGFYAGKGWEQKFGAAADAKDANKQTVCEEPCVGIKCVPYQWKDNPYPPLIPYPNNGTSGTRTN